jgi:hypothetical protein
MIARARAVAHMHLVDRLTLFVLPLGICATAFAVNLVIWQFVPVDGRSTGGASSLQFFVLAAAILAVVRGLPFALGMGASRRAFVVGTGMTGLVLAVFMGTVWAILRRIEEVSGGWWLHGHFFDFPWMHQSSWGVVWLMLVLSISACFTLGTAVASIWSRFGTLGLLVGGPVAVVVLGGLSGLVSIQHWWGHVWSWFGDLTPLSASGCLAVAVVVLTASSWGTLRRVSAR